MENIYDVIIIGSGPAPHNLSVRLFSTTFAKQQGSFAYSYTAHGAIRRGELVKSN